MTQKMENVLRAAGKIILSAHDLGDKTQEKGEDKRNLVTVYDKKVQEFLYTELAGLYPDAHFMGEEEENAQFSEEGLLFIIDPIDGTANFVHHLEHSCISVGVMQDGKPRYGFVFDPYKDRFYAAEKGKGATLNGKPIHVTDYPLEESLVRFGTSPYYADLAERSFRLLRKVFSLSSDVRRSGSAALDLCELAAGEGDGFFELRLSPWDYAAGALIVEEAGGLVSGETGEMLPYSAPSAVVAGNPRNFAALLKAVQDSR